MFPICYYSQMKLRKGNVFTPVCQSSCSQLRGVSQHALGSHPLADTPRAPPPLGRPPCGQTQTPPLGRHTPPGQTPLPPAGHDTGRYASYWNAFLLEILSLTTRSQRPKKQSNCYCYHLNKNYTLWLIILENSLFYQVHIGHQTT